MLGREAGYKEFKGWNETRADRVSIVGSNKEGEATNKQVVNATGKGNESSCDKEHRAGPAMKRQRVDETLLTSNGKKHGTQ